MIFSRIISAFFLFFLLSSNVLAKPYVTLRLSFSEYAADTMILGHYYGKDIVFMDRIALDALGEATYTLNHKGIYLLYTPDTNSFEFMVADSGNYLLSKSNSTFNISSNKQSTAYNNYLLTQQNYAQQMTQIQKDSSGTDSESRIRSLRHELKESTNKLYKAYNNTFLGTYIKTYLPVTIPEFDIDPDLLNADSIRWTKSMNYYKAHYLDSINWNEEDLAYTPAIEDKLNDYFRKILPKSAKQAASDIDEVFKKIPKNQLRSFTIIKTVEYFHKLKHHAQAEYLYLHLLQNFYFKEDVHVVDDPARSLAYENDYAERKALSLFETAPEINLPNKKQQNISLSDQEAYRTVIVFWDFSCEKCLQIMEEFGYMMENHANKDIRIITLYTGNDLEVWRAMAERKLNKSWDNLYRTAGSTVTRDYQVNTLPCFYLLDEKGRILDKHLTVRELNDLL